jgi:hypothetical protein
MGWFPGQRKSRACGRVVALVAFLLMTIPPAVAYAGTQFTYATGTNGAGGVFKVGNFTGRDYNQVLASVRAHVDGAVPLDRPKRRRGRDEFGESNEVAESHWLCGRVVQQRERQQLRHLDLSDNSLGEIPR